MQALLGMWADKKPHEAWHTLAQPDVTVTNFSDKTTQLRKILKFSTRVQEAFAVSSAGAYAADPADPADPTAVEKQILPVLDTFVTPFVKPVESEDQDGDGGEA